MGIKLLRSKALYTLLVILFAGLIIWWIYVRQFPLDSTHDSRQLWGATYQILAFYGGICGVMISRKWGGYKSLLGRAVLAFSIGLFLQVFGQTFSSLYVYIHNVESPPYPAIGDIGFFGSVIAYIYGVFQVSKVSGAFTTLKKSTKPYNKIITIALPIVVIFASYTYFLKGYEFDWTGPIKIFLDFGYPIGQALYVSFALLTLYLSRNVLGGIMKKPIILLLFALIFQFFSDSMFLYQAALGNWFVGGINDFLYMVSYFLMAMSIIYIGTMFGHIQES